MAAHKKDYDRAVEMYGQGDSIAVIAKYHCVSRQAMHAILRRRGVVFRSNLKFGTENHFFKEGVESDSWVHGMVSKAIAKGILVAQPCEQCGAGVEQKNGRSTIHAHHDDYNKPFNNSVVMR